jgi:hypothetical protein
MLGNVVTMDVGREFRFFVIRQQSRREPISDSWSPRRIDEQLFSPALRRPSRDMTSLCEGRDRSVRKFAL